MKVNIADVPTLARLLNRKKRYGSAGYAVDLSVILSEILTWANRLVPSESGSILLDDPLLKWNPEGRGQLFFAACFGRGSRTLVGTSLGEDCGIAGVTYRKGRPYISKDVQKDSSFYPAIDRRTGFRTRSVICAPIVIGGAKIGVIELINRKGKANYDEHDLALLEIFAGYTATLIHNALIGRMFEELSKKDSLTDLHNDRFFFHTLEQEAMKIIKQGGDMSLIFFDLDRFKEVNDTHGHLAGSRVLKEVADILRKIFIGVRAVLARYGGDEYVVVLPGADIREAGKYAERIRHDIAGNVFLRSGDGVRRPRLNIRGVITCSVGVASMAESIRTPGSARAAAESLIKAADSAMYAAKEQGKNRVFLSQRGPGAKRRR
ncbi:MAG: sensor domain-containing diguanylate cyclase [Nitrospiraceae bacterium]|nr:sensor domain-containing diguanylate cyclase [Nitrospiraceae bacterium]